MEKSDPAVEYWHLKERIMQLKLDNESCRDEGGYVSGRSVQTGYNCATMVSTGYIERCNLITEMEARAAQLQHIVMTDCAGGA